jgi:hypothetical protein
MSELLKRKLELLDAKMKEIEWLGARLNEGQRMVAQEADRLLHLKEQLTTLLKREYWNAASGRPGMAGRPMQGRTTGGGVSMPSTVEQQANVAIEAVLTQADQVHARLIALLKTLLPPPPPQPAIDVPPLQAAVTGPQEEEFLAVIDEDVPQPSTPVRPVAVTPRPATVPHRPAVVQVRPTVAPKVIVHREMPAPAHAAPVAHTAAAHAGPSSTDVNQSHGHAEQPAAPALQVQPSHEAEVQVHPVAAAAYKERPAAAPPASPTDGTSAEDEAAIQAAIATGRKALESLDRSIEAAQSVTHGGVWHAVSSAIHTSSSGHARLHEARTSAHEAAENLRLFQRQVMDLRHRLGAKAEVGQLGELADQLVRGIPVEGDEGAPAAGALSHARQTYREVRALCARLQLDAAALRSRLAARDRGRPTR